MLLDVGDGVALGRISHQDLGQQILALRADRDAGRKVVVNRQDPLQYLTTTASPGQAPVAA